VTESRFSDIFGTELHGRLLWFGRLRWLAVCGLALGSLLGSDLGFDSVWPSLFAVAVVVAFYNLLLQGLLRRRKDDPAFANLRAIAIGLIVMDLAALMVTAHFTGGLQSPLLPFFAFHMALGTVILSGRLMYVVAAGVSLVALALVMLEARGVLEFHPLAAGVDLDATISGLNLLALVAALFGIVYLTDSVANRLKSRSIDLYETTGALTERTEELQRLLGEMEDLEQRKSHYMRLSSHQLRSPLGTIRTTLQVLVKGIVDPSTEKGRKLLTGAVDVTDNLLSIVNDLLDLAKIREGRARAPWSQGVNLNQLLADLFDSLAPDAEERQVTMVPDFKGVAVLDWGIAPELVHAFENLIYNGIKYNTAGRSVTVELRSYDDEAVIRFIDEGIGIPDDYRDQIFVEFVRAPNARRHAGVGTGLGLAIVREVIEVHGGTVALENRSIPGSTFTVRLPLHHRPPESDRLLQAGNERGYGPGTGGED
jgi:signal transduction histidine kinase